jgi:uncharacterized protein
VPPPKLEPAPVPQVPRLRGPDDAVYSGAARNGSSAHNSCNARRLSSIGRLSFPVPLFSLRFAKQCCCNTERNFILLRRWKMIDAVRGILDRLSRGRPREPDVRLKISNLTRQTELARLVEVADRGAKRRKGLLGRERLSPEEGLWIVPCEAIHTLGMRFPIDLVYLDRSKRVTKVRSDVPPWRMSVCLSAHSVLELASGTVRRTRTRPGDKLEFTPASPPKEDNRSSA